MEGLDILKKFIIYKPTRPQNEEIAMTQEQQDEEAQHIPASRIKRPCCAEDVRDEHSYCNSDNSAVLSRPLNVAQQKHRQALKETEKWSRTKKNERAFTSKKGQN